MDNTPILDPNPVIATISVRANGSFNVTTPAGAVPLPLLTLIWINAQTHVPVVAGQVIEDEIAALRLLTMAAMLVVQHHKQKAAQVSGEASKIIQLPPGARMGNPWANGR